MELLVATTGVLLELLVATTGVLLELLVTITGVLLELQLGPQHGWLCEELDAVEVVLEDSMTGVEEVVLDVSSICLLLVVEELSQPLQYSEELYVPTTGVDELSFTEAELLVVQTTAVLLDVVTLVEEVAAT